jgi:Effector-associated domain 11
LTVPRRRARAGVMPECARTQVDACDRQLQGHHMQVKFGVGASPDIAKVEDPDSTCNQAQAHVCHVAFIGQGIILQVFRLASKIDGSDLQDLRATRNRRHKGREVLWLTIDHQGKCSNAVAGNAQHACSGIQSQLQGITVCIHEWEAVLRFRKEVEYKIFHNFTIEFSEEHGTCHLATSLLQGGLHSLNTFERKFSFEAHFDPSKWLIRLLRDNFAGFWRRIYEILPRNCSQASGIQLRSLHGLGNAFSNVNTDVTAMKTLIEITTALEHGRVQQALEALSKLIHDQLSGQRELRNSVISLLARYNHLQSKLIHGIVRDGEAQITENQIVFATLEMIEILREELNSRELPATTPQAAEDHRIKILFFAANPLGEGQLNLGREIREIEASLSRAKLRDRFEFIQTHATRPKDFLKRILEVRPGFVHFSGHGSPQGIYMLDEDDQPQLMSTKQLTEVFKLFSEVVGCVVLNACYSDAQAGQIRDYVPNVIGTTQKLGDEDAIEFASLFYTAIGEGQDIAFAYEFARLGLDLAGEEGGGVFVMR